MLKYYSPECPGTKRTVSVFLLLLPFVLRAQPGPFGSDLYFSLRNPEQLKNSLVLWYDEDTKQKSSLSPGKDGMYRVECHKTPLGGNVRGHVEIVYKKDTMYIYPPYLNGRDDIELTSIPFHKGRYCIPGYIYTSWELFSPDMRHRVRPSLDGDWQEFDMDRPDLLPSLLLRREEMIRHGHIGSLLGSRDGISSITASCIPGYFFRDKSTGEKIMGHGIWFPSPFPYYCFGILQNTNVYFLLRERDSLLEYGILDLPDGIEDTTRGQEGDLFWKGDARNAEFSTYLFAQSDLPRVLGYYRVNRGCGNEPQHTIERWGIFSVQIGKPDAVLLKTIRNEHRDDNCLPPLKE